jgi:CRISPR-associated endonuclease/helicase Cas3
VTLDIDAFERFFAENNGGSLPFGWQRRLVEHVLSEGAWPRAIVAPTGTGKTSVIDVHAFVNAVAHERGLRLPRRLVMTVNRRSLVDSHAEHAKRLADNLQRAEDGSASREVADLLRARSAHDGVEGPPLSVHTIRGGLPIGRDWRQAPAACAVLCMTPDMWGSRALFRGYGTSRWARSLEAGVLVRDTVLVLDEVHLNRQLLCTARRIAYLDALTAEGMGVTGLQVVATTATPDEEGGVGVSPSDLTEPGSGPVLAARLETPKPVTVRELEVARAQTEKLAAAFVDEMLAIEPAAQGATVGCVVNTVALAREVRKELTERPGVAAADVAMLVGGLAPLAAEEVVAELGLGGDGTAGDRRKRFVVGTQALEVGLDIDLGALVTELAPGSALAQRFGRLNRHGRRGSGPAVVVAPKYDPKDTRVPYEHDELVSALAWIKELAATEAGVATTALMKCPPPQEARRRLLYQRLEWPDVHRLARTSEDLAVAETDLPDHGEDLTLWLRDSFDEEVEASAVVRDLLPTDTLAAARAADLTPPLDAETYRSSLRRIRRLAQALRTAHEGPLIVYRAGRATVLDEVSGLQPGDTLVIEPWRAARVHHNEEAAHVWGRHAKELEDLHEAALERLVRHAREAGERSRPAGEGEAPADGYWQVRIARSLTERRRDGEPPPSAEPGAKNGLQEKFELLLSHAERLASASADGGGSSSDRPANDAGLGDSSTEDVGEVAMALLSTVAEVLPRLLDEEWSRKVEAGGFVYGARALGEAAERLAEAAAAADTASGVLADLVTTADGSEYLLVLRSRQLHVQDEARSEHSRGSVRLADHVNAVTARAEALAAKVGLSPGLAEAVRRAAELHDAGKAHPRFQRYLRRGRRGEALLAKSGYPFDLTAHRRYGLSGWRHEQLSAAVAWSRAQTLGEPELVTWLVGTSHGRGRAAFDHDSRALYFASGAAGASRPNTGADAPGPATATAAEAANDLDAAADAAAELFDEGLWEEWCERLSRRFGPWGLAYLEAVLRASDQTVSAEGR